MTTIYLIRHAEAEGNRYRRAHGWYNSTITDRGYRQIAALAKRFADTKFDAVYSSDRFRTMITALSIYKTHGLPLRTIRALREIDKTGHAENTAVAKLEYENSSFNVVFRDDASHLGDEITTVRKQPWVNDPKGFEGGIYYRASGEAGHFDVMHGEEIIGAVSVTSCRGGVGTIGEFWLENHAQRRDLGEKLVGQALSYARSRGCSILSTGRIPKSNAAALHCAEKWGFHPVQEDAESVIFEKNFEYDEESCYRRLQEVIEK